MNLTKVNLKPCFLTTKKIQPDYPLFIYLPGMDGTGQLLRSQTAGLEAGFDVRCLAIPRQDLTSWDELSRNVLDLIYTELGKNSQRSVYLCGESFGGCLAQKVAIQAPEIFKRIILINPASSFRLRSWYTWASPLMNLLPPWIYDVAAVGLLPFLVALTQISNSDREELLKTIRSIPSETILWRLSLLREFDIDEAKLRRLRQPILLMGSIEDRLLPSIPEIERLSQIFPNSQTVILPQSGHACLLEQNINLFQILQAEDFLEPDVKESQLFANKN
ncbi:alpha/beta fold hydrolase [Calothrix sp. PCC 6303]|uniref:alpha/beta fold hydrolase n=1 Tax=Calothrix sp. PCC 6303 TaxID=1170562 RepID=UPI0002A01200|nr:alpha/beta hydrolase [Calothrix sp. PCC 6303]AFZ00082.1 alpha/beta hydrolase fold protein [Calothrix sp. PCC 6303]